MGKGNRGVFGKELYFRKKKILHIRAKLPRAVGIETLRPYLMYENLTIFTEHASFYLLWTIDDPSGRIIWCRLHLSKFYFEFKYKKLKINLQTDEISLLNTTGDTIPHDGNEEIRVCELELVNYELEFNNTAYEVNLIDFHYGDMDDLYAAMDDQAPSHTNFEPIGVRELP